MSLKLRIALPGYNALTDQNPDHHSVFADADNILIKEKNRGTITVADNATGIVSHGLGYIPFFMAYANIGFYWMWIYGDGIFGQWEVYATTTDLRFKNKSGSTASFRYYLFYDNMS